MLEQDLTLRDLLHRIAATHPDNDAVADGICRYTYRELLDAVQRMAKLLHTLGVRKGDRVALLMPASVSHAVALFGAIELGAIPCGLHVRESEATLAAILERLSPRVLVYDGAFDDRADALRRRVPLVTAAVRAVSEITPSDKCEPDSDPVIPRDLEHYRLDFEPMPIGTGDTAVIALSSGTTGLPKGIMHTHQTLLASARIGTPYMAATDTSCAINLFSTAFIGWYNTFLPFLYGASRIIFMSRWDPQQYLRLIEFEKVTVCFLVPTMWRMLLRENLEDYDLSSMQRVGYAGEPMDTATMAQLRERICPNVVNTYGTTETGSWGGCTVMEPDDYVNTNKIESVGRPGKEVEIRVIEPGGAVDDTVAAGEEGEVIISGPSVASQIWEQPELARQIFDGRWWRSGDMGVMDQDGYLYLHGRVDDMIISGGINVLPGAVEDVILSHPAVAECVVIGLPHEKWGQQITAFVMCKAAVTAEELAAHVDRSSLSGYKKPREYRFVDEIPRGNTGKVSRRLLREQVLASA
jgi:acyl-coenzyme A synthetase/AMP-(fatty) acid ligase